MSESVKPKTSKTTLIIGGLFVIVAVIVAFFYFSDINGGGYSLSSKQYTIRVTGTHGTKFSGSWGVVGSGAYRSETVEGTVPTEYSASGQSVSVVFQKTETGGTLKVEILEGGSVRASGVTSASYGVVSVAY